MSEGTDLCNSSGKFRKLLFTVTALTIFLT